MITFRKRFAQPILDEVKTETRRTWERPRVRVGAVHQCRHSRFGEPFAHVLILDVRRERLGAMTDRDARAEGVADMAEFMAVWADINGTWDDGLEVYVVTFELCGPAAPMPSHPVVWSGELLRGLALRDDDGNRVRVELGEPDAAGLYMPALIVDTRDNVCMGCRHRRRPAKKGEAE